MAIVNLTPDSFYDGGKYSSIEDVLFDVEEKIGQGADIIDIGAASSRPNSKIISKEEEWQRLEPILKGLRKRFPKVVISIDTYRAAIAKQAALEGADMINDIGGGSLDDQMFDTIAELNLPYILMHIQGTPQTMQQDPKYIHLLDEIRNMFRAKVKTLLDMNFHKIILDPGFGFGKTLENNFTLLKGLKEFTSLGFPVLAGISRKGMINQVIGTSPVTALTGTTVLHTIALLNGASLLRVHDVKEARQAIQLVQFYENA